MLVNVLERSPLTFWMCTYNVDLQNSVLGMMLCILQALLVLKDFCDVRLLYLTEKNPKSFDLSINASNREHATMVSNMAPCPPYIHEKELLLYWENFSVPLYSNSCCCIDFYVYK